MQDPLEETNARCVTAKNADIKLCESCSLQNNRDFRSDLQPHPYALRCN